jgi:hypothetical protein
MPELIAEFIAKGVELRGCADFATAWNDGIYEIRGFNQFSNGCTVGGVD